MKTIDKKKWILFGVMLVAIILGTWLLSINIPYQADAKPQITAGYVTLGDVFVYISAMVLCGPLAAIASAVGGLVADLISGHGGYALGSFVIKGVMALIAMWQLRRAESFIQRVKALLFAGVWMIIGYFLYDFIIRGNYLIAAIGLPFHILQVIACVGVASLVLFLTGWKPYQKEMRNEFSSGTSKRNLK